MNKLQVIKFRAREAAYARNHELGPFERITLEDRPNTQPIYRAKCRLCNNWVDVNLWPRANETEISGPAVAMICPSLEESPSAIEI